MWKRLPKSSAAFSASSAAQTPLVAGRVGYAGTVKLFRKLGKLSRQRQWTNTSPAFLRADQDLRALTVGFITARTISARSRRAAHLLHSIWGVSSDRRSLVRLLRWIRLLEQDTSLRSSFQAAWDEMLANFDSVPLFAETGLPSHHSLPSEVVRRIFERFLPSARDQSDTIRFLAVIFPSFNAVDRFVGRQAFIFDRLIRVLWHDGRGASLRRLHEDLRQAISLLAARLAGRGASPAIRQRGSLRRVEDSPFNQLFFVTARLLQADSAGNISREEIAWNTAVADCLHELEEVHLHMEDAGVSSALVYDLRSMEATLERMQLLAAIYIERHEHRRDALPAHADSAVRSLTAVLLHGRLDDVRLRALVRDNLTLLARKTVERTGHGGEHYIAHTRADYWLMWRAAAGGGLLTVFTAAIKMRVIESHFPLAVEGFLIGTDYAISFLLLQIFGFALATKQPSMTAATLAGIVRKNRGVARWSKISEFAADISRTQLAAAFSNIIAVCSGAVVFERLWTHFFKTHYLPAESAQHVYQTLHPFTSGTAIFAAFTGVLLWLAAVIGGWFENFAIYHRVPEAISQHPLAARMGSRTMRRIADWLERNAASGSTSIILGYLLGFSPVVARFFGIPFDVRHVTLSTGTLALAAARFGTGSFEHGWLYYAIAGIAITFVLNLGVSFTIASIVALRAYDVPWAEQAQILRFLIREIIASPLSFIVPLPETAISVVPESVTLDPPAREPKSEVSLRER